MFQEWRNREVCPRAADLLALWEEELPPAQAEAMRLHRESCALCAEEWEELNTMKRTLVEGLPVPEASVGHDGQRKAALLDRCRRSISDVPAPFPSAWRRWKSTFNSRIRLHRPPLSEGRRGSASPSARRAATGLAAAALLGAAAGFWVTRQPDSPGGETPTAESAPPSPTLPVAEEGDAKGRYSVRTMWIGREPVEGAAGPVRVQFLNARISETRSHKPAPEEHARNMNYRESPEVKRLNEQLFEIFKETRRLSDQAQKAKGAERQEIERLREELYARQEELSRQADRIVREELKMIPTDSLTPAELEEARKNVDKHFHESEFFYLCGDLKVTPSGEETVWIGHPSIRQHRPEKPHGYIEGTFLAPLPPEGITTEVCNEASVPARNGTPVPIFATVPAARDFRPLRVRMGDGALSRAKGSYPTPQGRRDWTLRMGIGAPHRDLSGVEEARKMGRFATLRVEEGTGKTKDPIYPLLQVDPPWRLLHIGRAERSRPGRQVTLYHLGLPPSAPSSARSRVSISYMPARMLEGALKPVVVKLPAVEWVKPDPNSIHLSRP